MSDRRRIIAALEAKAASTTFPAEAEALRAKADELRADLPPEPRYTPPAGIMDGTLTGWFAGYSVGDLWGAAGGVTVRVTNVSGNSYTIWVE